MASVQRQPGTRYWIAVFRDKEGRQKRRSTRSTVRHQALKIADSYEQVFKARDTVAHVRRTLRELTIDLGGAEAVMTVAEFLKMWLERRRPALAKGSAISYTNKIRAFLAHLSSAAPADLPADGLTPAMVAEYRDKLATEVSPTTVNQHLTVLRAAFGDGQDWGHVTRNVVAMIDPVKDTAADCSRRPFTLEEIKLVLSACDAEWRSMVLFGLYTGQRLGDIAGLTWETIDLARDEIRLVTSKTGRRMKIALAPALRQHIMTMPSSDDPKAPLHPRASASLRKSGTAHLSRDFGDLLRSVGLSKAGDSSNKTSEGASPDRRRVNNELSFHALRHTAATWLRDAGASEAVSREIVGHDSESVARLYVHAGKAAMQKAVSGMPDVTI